MANTITQEVDIKFVKKKLENMQKEKVFGHVTIKFEAGVMQIGEIYSTFWPPSRKYKGKNN